MRKGNHISLMISLGPKNIAFFLGAGVSIPAQLPSTKDITDQILSGNEVVRHTDGTYLLGGPLYSVIGLPDEYVPRVLKFLGRIKIEIEYYYDDKPDRFVNYEDLYFIASQIKDSESGEYDNAVVQPFIDKILPDIQPILIGNNCEVRQSWRLQDIADETTHYISDIVYCMLSKRPDQLDHLCCIKDACEDTQLDNVDIYTLNHDILLEQYLLEKNIQISDGFGKPINNVRYWDPDLFSKEPFKVRLLKLHGSVNWFRFRPDGGDWSQESIGISLEPDIWHTKDKNGQKQMPIDGRPMFLAGTFNKMLQYTSGIYADLHYQFYHSLQDNKRLIICGYSFGDKGINTRIIEWIYSFRENKIIIVHPHPDNLKQNSRGAIRNKWDNLMKQGRLSIVQKRIEDTSWQDIKNILIN